MIWRVDLKTENPKATIEKNSVIQKLQGVCMADDSINNQVTNWKRHTDKETIYSSSHRKYN